MKRVLIAEDDPASRELLGELVRALGYEVVEAGDGGEALEKARAFLPDLAFLDIQMPVLDGVAVLRELRNDPQLAVIPILVVTAYSMRGDRERALKAGFDGYLAKPVDAKALRSELIRYLGVPAQP